MAFGINRFQQSMQDKIGAQGQDAAMKAAAEATAKQLGIPAETVLFFLRSQSSGAPPGMFDLGSLAIEKAMGGGGGGGGGGGDGGSYSMGIDPAAEFNQTMAFNREASIADFIGQLISDEVQRKGMALTTGESLIKDYHDAMANAVPSNMTMVPGFEPGGMVEKMGKMMNINVNPMLQSGQNMEKGTIPFSTIAGKWNEFQNMTPESQVEKYKPLVEAMFSQMPQLENIQTSGSWSGGGDGGGSSSGYAPLPPEDVAATVSSSVNERLANLMGTIAGWKDNKDKKTDIMLPPHGGWTPTGQSELQAMRPTAAEMDLANKAWESRKTGKGMTEEWLMNWIKNHRKRKASGKTESQDVQPMSNWY